MTATNLLAGIIFSSIGLGASIYGKRQENWKVRIIGGLLLFYPWIVWDTVPLIVIGSALTIALFLFGGE